jgi:hypothetical protein
LYQNFHQRIIAVSGTLGLLHKGGVPVATAKLIIGRKRMLGMPRLCRLIKRRQAANTMGNYTQKMVF